MKTKLTPALLALLLTALASPLGAAEKAKFGGALSVDLPLDDLKTDTNNRLGLGLAFQIGIDLGGGSLIRPEVGFNAYSAKHEKRPGSSYREDITLGNVEAGADYLYFPGATTRTGFYLLAGLRIERWATAFSTRDEIGSTTITTSEVTHQKTALGGKAGLGYQFTNAFGVEARYARSSYNGTLGARVSDSSPESPVTDRTATAIQVSATLRF